VFDWKESGYATRRIRCFFRRKPNKTDTRYVDFWGHPRRRIHYNDTGKVVKQVHTLNWRGQPVK
jgi:hypothetical protein